MIVEIPPTLRSSIALAYAESLSSVGMGQRLIYVRSLLSLLRTGFILNSEIKSRIDALDIHIGAMEHEVALCENSAEEGRNLESRLFKVTSRAIDFAGPFVFSGYATMGTTGISFRHDQEVKK